MCAWHDIRGVALSVAMLAMAALPAAAGPQLDVIRDPALPKDVKGLDFEIGRALFERQWAAAPSSTQAADGLGPLFNARSCVSCHTGGGRGAAYDAAGNVLPALLFKLGPHGGAAAATGDPVYGQQIQPESVLGLGGEAHPDVRFEIRTVTLADGTEVELRKPVATLDGLAFGLLAPETVISPRLASAINGMGLLERIPETEILARADPDDRDGDGISGRPNEVLDPATGKRALGRFGWKAGEPSLEVQDAKALDLDIGLSNPIYRDAYGDCTKREAQCLAMPNGASPQFENLEVPSSLTRLIDRFVAEAVLPGLAIDSKSVAQGRKVFMAAGCEACHRAQFDLPASGALPARTIAPYSDLMLHDMGMGLADHLQDGDASGREWRTAPLWGIGVALRSGKADLLHDGRARNVLEAILWHDGEAAAARKKVEALGAADRQALIDFIGSL
ncbi:MAG TPA: di-heme oxidoredictase family protein [Dongiaceae bacterium]|nr:di-heme oxidoredictase family protein [Dongiaceae bacterium]